MTIRNMLFNLGIFNTYQPKIPTISIGNLSMGGTGKTPHVDFLINHLKNNYRLTVLSRGYGRKTKGFVKGTQHSTAETLGDEPLLYKRKHTDEIEVIVSEDRVLAAKRIENTDTEILLLDDAYQHRKIGRHLNILITTFQSPFFKDFVVPVGNLREFKNGKKRANIIIVSKCPENIDQQTKEAYVRKINANKNQKVFFSSISYGPILPIGHDALLYGENYPEEILLVTGIANPEPLEKELKKKFKVETKKFPDHHKFTSNDLAKIHTIFDTFVSQKKAIITTEKDLMRLLKPELLNHLKNYPWYYQSINVALNEEQNFLKEIDEHVNTNK